MIAFKTIKDILKVSIDWEKKLKDLYDVAEFGLADARSKKVIADLNQRHMEKLNVLQNLDVEKYGLNEWVRYAPAYKEEDIIPKQTIHRNSSPEEIVSILIDCITRIKNFYNSLHSMLITQKQQELFASLIQFKDIQLEEITNIKKGLG